jgi:hypothetical protein
MVTYQEDCEDFMRESKTYRKVLEHRRKCDKWGKGFCLECFGGGLTKFTKELAKENLSTRSPSKSQDTVEMPNFANQVKMDVARRMGL